jgi:alpha-1,3/alpha-1,6-mannosyltransferase
MAWTYADQKKGRNRPTLISLNRFEKKKNTALAIEAFALLRTKLGKSSSMNDLRLVIAGWSSFRYSNPSY